MKARVYLRFAKATRGLKVDASTKPIHYPLDANQQFLPTASFAVDFNIPDELFEQASTSVGEINLELKGAKVVGKMIVPEVKKFIQDRENEESLNNMRK
jgi:hypothetical protein